MTTAAKRGPGRPRNESTDAAILAAAVDELIERGFIAASMESVAARAGVAKTTLYRRWPSIHELAIAAMETFEQAPDDLPEGSVRDTLVWALDAMRRKWGNPRYAAMMRRVAADGTANPALYRQSRDRLIGPYVRAMNAVIRRGIDEGVLSADIDVDWVRGLLVSPIMAASLTLRDRVTYAQLELTVDTVLRGLSPRAE
ncbi:MAG TPA: TetR/AcrR family transcriptional regulator [Jatrophihabitantaceae bacterium]|nr:TetR/AcrR family transcriptional regulator [Jatrophihabitantaceae bacterium]